MVFEILVDTAEIFPFTFTHILGDSDRDYLPLAVSITYQSLGRHPNSLGDYSLIGGIGKCHIERKSMEDCQSTILGFNDGHRERFESELSNLNEIDSAMVLVECSFGQLLANAPEYGKKTKQQNAKTLSRSVLAYIQDYPRVQWLFCDSRELAEIHAYWFLRRWWEKNLKVKVSRKVKKLLDSI